MTRRFSEISSKVATLSKVETCSNNLFRHFPPVQTDNSVATIKMISNSNRRRTQPESSSSRMIEEDIPARLAKMQDDREKDDEELDLEASLFGKKRKRAGRGSRGSGKGKAKAEEEVEEIEGGMPGVFWEDTGDAGGSSGGNADEVSCPASCPCACIWEAHNWSLLGQMFYEDAPLAVDREEESEIDFEQDLEADSDDLNSEQDDDQDSGSESDSDSDDDADPETPATPGLSWLSNPSSSKASKKALWSDPSDNKVSVDMSTDNRLRKLVRTNAPGTGSTVDGQGLESKLREQFEKMHPKPEWASEAKARASKEANGKKNAKGKVVDPLQALFASTASFVDTSSSLTNRGLLHKGALEVRRLRDANYQNRTVWEGGLGKKKVQPGKGSKKEEAGKKEYTDTGMMDVKFHAKVEVLAAVGADRRLRLFNVSPLTVMRTSTWKRRIG